MKFNLFTAEVEIKEDNFVQISPHEPMEHEKVSDVGQKVCEYLVNEGFISGGSIKIKYLIKQ